MPAVKGLRNLPRSQPCKPHGDKVDDYRRCRVRSESYSRIAGCKIESSSEIEQKNRSVVEQTHEWFTGFGKLRIRFEKSAGLHLALLKLTAVIICTRFADRFFKPLIVNFHRNKLMKAYNILAFIALL